MLAEGWMKWVPRGINPFEQKFKSYADNQVNTIVSMISQAGSPFVGAVPLNQEAANQLRLARSLRNRSAAWYEPQRQWPPGGQLRAGQ